jgi:hypothetical protein
MIQQNDPLNSSMMSDDQYLNALSNDGTGVGPSMDSSLHEMMPSSHEPSQPITDFIVKDSNTLLSRIEKEQKLFEIHSAIVTEKWKNILRQEKSTSLREEGSLMKEYYQQELQRKDNLIQLLMDACEQSENQSQAAFSSYMENLLVILQTFESQLQSADDDFTTMLQHLSEEFRHFCEYIEQNAYGHIQEYQECIKRIELCEKDDLEQKTLRCQNIIDEIKKNAAQDIEQLRYHLDAKVEDLEDKLATAYTEFLNKTDCTSEELKMLDSQGDVLSSELKLMRDTIHDLKRSIRNLKKYSERDSKKCVELSHVAIDEKNQATHRYQAIKDELMASRNGHGRKLKHLALQAHNYKTDLSKRLVILERVVKQGHLFFPLQESQRPHKSLLEHDIGLFELTNNITTPISTSHIEDMLSNLKVFWKQYKSVKHELHDLKQEENRLQMKKESLKVGCFLCYSVL